MDIDLLRPNMENNYTYILSDISAAPLHIFAY